MENSEKWTKLFMKHLYTEIKNIEIVELINKIKEILNFRRLLVKQAYRKDIKIREEPCSISHFIKL